MSTAQNQPPAAGEAAHTIVWVISNRFYVQAKNATEAKRAARVIPGMGAVSSMTALRITEEHAKRHGFKSLIELHAEIVAQAKSHAHDELTRLRGSHAALVEALEAILEDEAYRNAPAGSMRNKITTQARAALQSAKEGQ